MTLTVTWPRIHLGRAARNKQTLGVGFDEQLHDLRVKLRALTLAQLGQRRLHGQGQTIDAVRRHGIKGVGYRDDPAAQRNLFAHESTRIPRPIPPLVMMSDRFHALPVSLETADDL